MTFASHSGQWSTVQTAGKLVSHGCKVQVKPVVSQSCEACQRDSSTCEVSGWKRIRRLSMQANIQ